MSAQTKPWLNTLIGKRFGGKVSEPMLTQRESPLCWRLRMVEFAILHHAEQWAQHYQLSYSGPYDIDDNNKFFFLVVFINSLWYLTPLLLCLTYTKSTPFPSSVTGLQIPPSYLIYTELEWREYATELHSNRHKWTKWIESPSNS